MEINIKIHVEQPAPRGVQRISSHKRDGPRDKQTNKFNLFGHPGGGWNLSPTKLGTVIDDLKHVLAPLKLLGSDAYVRRYGALKIWVQPDPINLKPP